MKEKKVKNDRVRSNNGTLLKSILSPPASLSGVETIKTSAYYRISLAFAKIHDVFNSTSAKESFRAAKQSFRAEKPSSDLSQSSRIGARKSTEVHPWMNGGYPLCALSGTDPFITQKGMARGLAHWRHQKREPMDMSVHASLVENAKHMSNRESEYGKF